METFPCDLNDPCDLNERDTHDSDPVRDVAHGWRAVTATAEDKIITGTEIEATDAVSETADGQTPAAVEQESPAPAPDAADEVAVALRIVKGNPSDEEIAALVSVLAAAAGAAAPEGDGKPPETWGEPTRMHRQWAPFSPYSYPNRG